MVSAPRNLPSLLDFHAWSCICGACRPDHLVCLLSYIRRHAAAVAVAVAVAGAATVWYQSALQRHCPHTAAAAPDRQLAPDGCTNGAAQPWCTARTSRGTPGSAFGGRDAGGDAACSGAAGDGSVAMRTIADIRWIPVNGVSERGCHFQLLPLRRSETGRHSACKR